MTIPSREKQRLRRKVKRQQQAELRNKNSVKRVSPRSKNVRIKRLKCLDGREETHIFL